MASTQPNPQGPITSSEIWETYKRFLPWVLVVAVLYFAVVPLLWPAPAISMQMPSAAVLGQDIEVTVTARAWHSNFEITRVRFWVDPLRSSALVSEAPFYPIDIRDVPPRSRWRAWSVNRFTWPRTRSYRLEVPLSQRWREGALQAGEIQGMLWITTETPQMGKFGRAGGGGRKTNATPRGIPFTLRLTPSTP